MKPALYATAFLAALAIVPLALAQSGEQGGKTAPAPAAKNAPTLPAPGRPQGMMGRGIRHGPGPGPWRGMMERRRMMMMGWGNPKEACIDRLARRAALLAYVGTKLDLTAQQRPLWQKLAATARDVNRKEVDLCNRFGAKGAKTVVDRLDLMRDMLSARLAGLNSFLPEIKAFYQVLTPPQKALLDRPWARD